MNKPIRVSLYQLTVFFYEYIIYKVQYFKNKNGNGRAANGKTDWSDRER